MLHFLFGRYVMLWWPGIVAVVLVVFWYLFLIKFGRSVAMVMHAYAISYERKHRLIAKLVGKGTDIFLLISIVHVVWAIAYYIWKFQE